MVRNNSKSEAKETKMRHKSVDGYRKVKICDIYSHTSSHHNEHWFSGPRLVNLFVPVVFSGLIRYIYIYI